MKKLLGILFCALVVAVCGCGGNKAKIVKYDKDMRFAFDCAYSINRDCKLLSDMVITEWNGELRSDKNPNEEMRNFLKTGTVKIFANGIQLDKQRIDSVNILLSDAPEERKDIYNDFVKLVSTLNTFSDLATNPSGSLFQYSNNVAEQKMKSSQLLNQFSMKYANILNEDMK